MRPRMIIKSTEPWMAKRRRAGRAELTDGKAHVVVNELHGVHGVYYFYRTVQLPAPMKVELTLRADDIFKLWVNNQLVLQRDNPDEEKGMSARVAVDLKQGE